VSGAPPAPVGDVHRPVAGSPAPAPDGSAPGVQAPDAPVVPAPGAPGVQASGAPVVPAPGAPNAPSGLGGVFDLEPATPAATVGPGTQVDVPANVDPAEQNVDPAEHVPSPGAPDRRPL
jgi:hypothetical protein